jgi:hypothetical protein
LHSICSSRGERRKSATEGHVARFLPDAGGRIAIITSEAPIESRAR